MSLTAFNRARRLKQIEQMKASNLKQYVDTNKSEIVQAQQPKTKQYVDKVVEEPTKQAIDKEKSNDILANTPKKRRKMTSAE